MRDKIIKKVMTLTLVFAMVFTMMPLAGIGVQEANAASAGDGGTVASNSASAAKEAFGSSNVTAEYSGSTLTITLNSDITLTAPVVFIKGSAGDTIVLDLKGHSLTGAAGTDSTTYSEAAGKDAIQIFPADFNVEIKGSGSVTGGKGAVYTSGYSFSTGAEGGMAVCFSGDEDAGVWSPDLSTDDGRLDYGLTVTGSSVLTGGAGADVTSSHWLANIKNYSGDRVSNTPYFDAGDGGAGIGQINTGISGEATARAYAKIVVDNGTVNGGKGGSIDMSDLTPTLYALMNTSEVASAMSGTSTEFYNSQVSSACTLYVGDGGDGILIGGGRKYVNIGSSGKVNGGNCGSVDLGSGKTCNRFTKDGGSPGDGIAVYAGDLGLTDAEAGWTDDGWKNKTETSDDMGMYVAGTVTGGSSPDETAMNVSASDGGNGIGLYGDKYYGVNDDRYGQNEKYKYLGIVEVASGASVTGGNSGSAVCGSGGIGGAGIYEDYDRDYESTNYNYGTDYYIINGSVSGGSGGTSYSNADSTENTNYATSVFVPALTRAGSFGLGGHGMQFKIYRGCLNVAGSGTVSSGDSGDTVSRDGADVSVSQAEAIYLTYRNDSDYNNTVSVGSETKGDAAQALSRDQLTVTAAMTAFDSYPTTSTTLTCDPGVPSGYTGNVYIKWYVRVYPNTGYGGSDYTGFPYDLESSGTNYKSFNLLNNTSYKYLAYDYSTYSGLIFYKYNTDTATVERIQENIQSNNTRAEIYCCVLLEDGRWGISDPMTFTKSGWDGSSSGGGSGGGDQPSQDETDQAAATEVENLILALPYSTASASTILSFRAEIEEARAAYDELTSAQKALVDPDLYAELVACEKRLKELDGESDAVDEIVSLIGALKDADEITTAEIAAEEKQKIDDIHTKFDALNYDQQDMLADETAALEKLAATEEKVNSLIEGASHAHLMQHIPARDATCRSEGNIEYYKCLTCAKLYKYADGTGELSEDDVIIARDDYAHVMTKVAAKAATCKAEGNKAYYRCTECGKLFEDADGTIEYTSIDSVRIPVDPNAHAWKNGAAGTTFGIDAYTITRTDTCTLCGATRLGVNNTMAYKKSLPKVKVAKGKAAKKKFTAKWKKVTAKNKKKIGGIEIQVSGPGYEKLFTAGKGKSSKVIKGLASKKKYKYRVRAYKGSGTSKEVSAWSGWKTVKVK